MSNVAFVSREEFLTLPFPESIIPNLKKAMDGDQFHTLIAVNEGGKIKAKGFSDDFSLETIPENCVAVCKLKLQSTNMRKSRTQQAVDLVSNKGYTVYKAAKTIGISHSAVYNAFKRRETNKVCPCCNQIVREGFKINKAVLKKG